MAEQCLKTGKEGIIDIEKMISEKNKENDRRKKNEKYQINQG